MNPDLARAARRWADQQTDDFAGIPASPHLVVTVSAFSGGVVTVSWRGASIVAQAYCAAYTPAVGDRVLAVIVNNQLIVKDQLV